MFENLNPKPDVFSKARLTIVSLIFALSVIGGNANLTLAQIEDKPGNLRDAATSPEKLSATFVEVTRRVKPAVVSIDTKSKMPEINMRGEGSGEEPDDILELLRRQMPRRAPSSVGSGFLVDKSGYILTNFHVVDDASRIVVSLSTGEEFTARIVGTDERTDLAVLKIDAKRDLPFVKLGDSETAQIGDWVLAIGSPFGLTQTVTAGIISQTKRETPTGNSFQRFIQTDAAINRGNSGGPLVNMKGEVIGVNSQIATSTGDYNGIGFALPSNDTADVYRQILENGRVRRGYLGVLLDSVKTEFAKVYNLPEAKGAIITQIADSKSAAAIAGLKANDVILEFNGEQVADAQDLIQKVASTAPGQKVSFTFLRENGNRLERKTLAVELAEKPSDDKFFNDEKPRKLPLDKNAENLPPLGLTLKEISPELIKVYDIENEKGVIVKKINPASFIADVKSSTGGDALNEGDLIQRVNRQPVTDLESFNQIAKSLKKGDAVVMHVVSFNRIDKTTFKRVVQFTVQ